MAGGPRRVSHTPRSAEGSVLLRQGERPVDLLDDESVLFLLQFGIRLGVGIFGVSERTLRRRFQEYGVRLSDILADRRRREALLLLTGESPLKAISLRLGFSSTQTLARYLRREFGATATTLRNQLRQGEIPLR